ncbi:ferrous iron transport protein B [Zavarzinella formosa]|uniref:ferrous iron transport protein B n=1 Tax=Zavarzinella formosa TaxID=360055 RepID=UPI0002FC9DC6|nr:ferrous iron transport protein B [Zavarzinella formosa]
MGLPITIALVGNPNTGKSTLFNALTGLNQRVGNYSGVTVEMKKGTMSLSATESHEIIDLPGTYSLAPRSLDEMVSVDLLLGHLNDVKRPDVIVSIVDASNLERHFYLTTQLMELGRPVVVAVNMMDVAKTQGIQIDLAKLRETTGLPIIPIQANRKQGLDELKKAVVAAVGSSPPKPVLFPSLFGDEVKRLADLTNNTVEQFLIARWLLDVGGHTEKQLSIKFPPEVSVAVGQARDRLTDAKLGVPGVEARTRYGWIRERVGQAVKRPAQRVRTFSDRLDSVLIHRVWGTLIFFVLMFALFQSIFVGAAPLMDLINSGKDWLATRLDNLMDPGPFRSLLRDGILKGVGGVLVFLPQILILFAVVAILEDCGYMARAAFLMDKIMSKCGLNGKSFIPLLSSVACAVPGIMATRTIENRRDRFATILVAPLMSCSARLPLYFLLIGTFLSEPWWLPGVVLFGMYLLGFVTAPLIALLLKRTVLRGETPVFVMEMPSFKMPQFTTVLRRMIEAGWAFVYRAGTMILASMILIWALLYFPNKMPDGRSYDVALDTLKTDLEQMPKNDEKVEQTEETKANDEAREAKQGEIGSLAGDWQRQSYLGRAGLALEPVFAPLGWDWKIGMAALASFPAREVVVGTLGIIYNQGEVDSGEIKDSKNPGDTPLGKTIKEEWSENPVTGKYRVAVAVSLLVFFALCCQCVSTLAVIWRETKSWRWPLFTFVYMTTLAYAGALIAFQVGRQLIG